MKRNWSQFLFL